MAEYNRLAGKAPSTDEKDQEAEEDLDVQSTEELGQALKALETRKAAIQRRIRVQARQEQVEHGGTGDTPEDVQTRNTKARLQHEVSGYGRQANMAQEKLEGLQRKAAERDSISS